MDENDKMVKLNPIWFQIQKEYELLKIVGNGSFGLVVKAVHKLS